MPVRVLGLGDAPLGGFDDRIGRQLRPGVEVGAAARGQPDALGAPQHPVGEIGGPVVVHEGAAAEAAFVAVARPDGVGMVPPVDQVAAGDVAPAEARAVAVVEIHQVVAAVVRRTRRWDRRACPCPPARRNGSAGDTGSARNRSRSSRAERTTSSGTGPVNDQVLGTEICFPSSPPEQVVMTVAPLPPRTRQPSSMRTSPISLISVKRPVFSRSPSSANDHQAQGFGSPAIFPGCKRGDGLAAPAPGRRCARP